MCCATWKNTETDKYDWSWDKSYLQEMLEKTGSQCAYFCGSSTNQEECSDLFDKVFLLEVDDDLLIKRLKQPDREHDFGSKPGEPAGPFLEHFMA